MRVLHIINEEIESRIENGISDKEHIFFSFLIEQQKRVVDFITLSCDMDKICYSAFVKSEHDVSKLVVKEQGKNPCMGFHYSDNLIELIAMAKHDFPFEQENIESYLNSSSLRDRFVMHSIFPQIELDKVSDDNTNLIDSVVSKILLTDSLPNSFDIITDAFSDKNDMIDLFILKKATQKILSFHPDRGLEKDLNEVILFHHNLSENIKNRYRVGYGLIIVTVLSLLVLGIGYFIISYWDTLPIEASLATFAIVTPLIGIIAYITVRKRKINVIDSTLKLYDSFISDRVENWYYRRTKYFKSSLDKIAKRIEKPSQ